MKINSNHYNYLLLNNLLRSKKRILICNYSLAKHSNWVILEQFLKKNGCKSFKIKNKLLLTFLKNNVFHCIKGSINGPVIIISLTNFTDFSLIDKLLNISIIKLSNKVYISNQLFDISSLDFKSNLKMLKKELNSGVKLFPLTLKKIKNQSNVI